MLTSTCVAPASSVRTSADATSPLNASKLGPERSRLLPPTLVRVPASAPVRALKRRASASAE